MSNTLRIKITSGTAHNISGKFFLTNSSGTVVNGTVRITIVDDSSFLDIVNPTSSTVSSIGSTGAITELDVSTSGGDIPTVNDLTVSSAVDATADASFPTINFTVQAVQINVSAVASFPTINFRVQSTDVTAAASFPTINFTVQGATPRGDFRIDVSLPTITFTVQGVTVTADSAAPASFPIIVFTVPTTHAVPNYIYAAQMDYMGRYRRGDELPIVFQFVDIPDAAPNIRILRGDTLIETFKLPIFDRNDLVFGFMHDLGNKYTNGNYILEMTWTDQGNIQYTIGYFDVLGGTGDEPIISIIEQQRPLGRAVVTIDDSGLARLQYNPAIRR